MINEKKTFNLHKIKCSFSDVFFLVNYWKAEGEKIWNHWSEWLIWRYKWRNDPFLRENWTHTGRHWSRQCYDAHTGPHTNDSSQDKWVHRTIQLHVKTLLPCSPILVRPWVQMHPSKYVHLKKSFDSTLRKGFIHTATDLVRDKILFVERETENGRFTLM